MSKKLLIAAVAAVLALGVTIAQATPSRLETLGQQNGLYLMDDTNIFWNPATAAYYSKNVLVHMGGYADNGANNDLHAYGGVVLGMGDSINLGLVVGRNPDLETRSIGGITGKALGAAIAPLPQSILGFPPAPATYPVTLNAPGSVGAMNWLNPFEAMLALKLGGMNLGVSYYLAHGKATNNVDNTDAAGVKTVDTEDEATAKLQSLKIGISGDMGNIQPELWFHYDPFRVNASSDDNLANTSTESELKGRRFNVGARAFIKMGDNLTLVPAFEWENASGDVTWDSTPDTQVFPLTVGTTFDDLGESYAGSKITTGLGINYTQDRILVATSLSFGWSKMEQTLDVDGISGEVSNTTKYLAIPITTLGIEYQATKILVLRAGISTTTLIGRNTTTNDNNVLGVDNSTEDRISTQDTQAAAGVGLHFGNLVVDMTLGGATVSGENDDQALFSNLDLKYAF